MANTSLYIPVLEERNKFKDYRWDVWGDSFSWYRERSWETIKHVVIHHSVTKPTNNTKSDVDYIAEIHRRNGWGGIGYHFVITSDGTVWYVGDISTQRANVADKNHLVIGVCLVGDFTKYNPTDEQILSAHDLCKFLINDIPALVNVKSQGWKALKGHKELQSTQCPGSSWLGAPDSMYERIKNRIPYTPQPEPEPVIDWEKRFKELINLCEVEKQEFLDKIKALESSKLDLESKLALNKVECEGKIETLTQKLENANSENPEIPTIDEFPENEVLSRAFDIIISRIMSKIPFKKTGGDKK